MSITDELREYAKHYSVPGSKKDKTLTAIADRIDETLASEYIRLPKDADGVPVHVGDWIYMYVRHKKKVKAVAPDAVYWWEPDGFHWCHAVEVRHYHEQTVEDVMVEFATDWECADDGEDKTAVLKEYADRIREVVEHGRDQLKAENAELREELAKARDPQRIGGQADPSSFVYAIEQLREFRWQHATNDEDAIPYINNVAAAHERENAKLRELVADMWFWHYEGNIDSESQESQMKHIDGVLDRMRELGVEVD